MRITRTLALLSAVLLGSAACSRVGDLVAPIIGSPSVNVVGDWLSTHRANDKERVEERMKFGDDGSFSSETLWIGFYGVPKDEVTGYSRTYGRYRLDGDKLQVSLTRSEHWQKYAVGTNPTTVTLEPVWGDRGSLDRDGDRLIHTYVSAPVDAPQTFKQVYQRER